MPGGLTVRLVDTVALNDGIRGDAVSQTHAVFGGLFLIPARGGTVDSIYGGPTQQARLDEFSRRMRGHIGNPMPPFEKKRRLMHNRNRSTSRTLWQKDSII